MTFRLPLALSALAASSLAADVPVKITPEKVRESYKTFTRITKEPKSVGTEFAGRCISTPAMDQVMKETGPHAMHYLHYYLNEVAQHHRAASTNGVYPTGSVIVKEKLFAGSAARSADFAKIDAVTGMIKCAPDSSPKTGDWEFFYFYPRSVPTEGKAIVWEKAKDLQSCVSCHSNAPDMVFGRFNEPYKMPKPGENRKDIRLEVAPVEGLPLVPKK